MNATQDAINIYHDILATGDLAQTTDAAIRRLLRQSGLYFGERPICTVLRPHFYFEENWHFLKTGLEGLMDAFNRAHEICCNSAEHRAQLRLEPYEEQLFSLDRNRDLPWTSSRLDTFFVVGENHLKCVEYNAETPAGLGYDDALVQTFNMMEVMARFQEKYHVRSLLTLPTLLESIIDDYQRRGGRQEPNIAILDWREVPTLNEHEIIKDFFMAQGVNARLGDPRDVEYRDNHLWLGDYRIDIVYKRVLYSELHQRMGMDNPLLNAVKDGAVYITNSPACKLMAKKASLAFMSDERNAALFNVEQHLAIDRCIPWTRYVEERKTFYQGDEVDLVDFIAQNKQKLVLKPNDEYGGKGVVIGWESTQEEWNATLKHALEVPYVAQEGVKIVRHDFPAWINGGLDISTRFVDADPYVFRGGIIHGVLTRLSPLTILNVTAGSGSVVPVYIIVRKE
jgi:uncharacterized circularly permuted ATP-grasp superfamily protein